MSCGASLGITPSCSKPNVALATTTTRSAPAIRTGNAAAAALPSGVTACRNAPRGMVWTLPAAWEASRRAPPYCGVAARSRDTLVCMSTRLPWTIAIVGLSASLFSACGGGGETSSEAAGTASGTGGSSTSAGTGGTGGASTASSSTGASAGGGGAGGATASSSSGGPAAIDAKLVTSDLYVNCQPIVAEDPVLGSFTA